jgi:uncharacterized membrane protein
MDYLIALRLVREPSNGSAWSPAGAALIMNVSLAIHTLAAVLWVGGMFFAHLVLRPSADPLEPATRLALWERVLGRFYVWGWLSVVALLVSGFAMLFLGFGGFVMPARYITLMTIMGILMATIYSKVYFVHWPQFRGSVATADWIAADRVIERIRRLALINLLLGLATLLIAVSGRHVG